MIDLQFDAAEGVWSWSRPAGPALSAAEELAPGIVIEADLADPQVITGFAAFDSEVARQVILGCLGEAAGPFVGRRASMTIEGDTDTLRARLALGRWVVANDEAARRQMVSEPLVTAGWVVDAALTGRQVTRELGLDVDLVTRHRSRLRAALDAISKEASPPPQADYLARRISRAAEALGDTDIEMSVLTQSLAGWVGAESRTEPDHRDVDVAFGGGLSPAALQVSTYRYPGNVIVHLNPCVAAVLGQRIVARLWRPDGTPLAFGEVRWTGQVPPGRAHLMVPTLEHIVLELTDRPQDPFPVPTEEARAPVGATVAAEEAEEYRLPPRQSPSAALASDALDVARSERTGNADSADWADIARRWRELSDQDRAWLAMEHALAIEQPNVRLGSGNPHGRRETSARTEAESWRGEMEAQRAALGPTWALERSEPIEGLRREPFIGDELANLISTHQRSTDDRT